MPWGERRENPFNKIFTLLNEIEGSTRRERAKPNMKLNFGRGKNLSVLTLGSEFTREKRNEDNKLA
jgi:hypothetical protein